MDSGPLSGRVYGFSKPANHRGYSWAYLWPRPVYQPLDKPWITGTSAHGHESYSGDDTHAQTA